MLHADSARNRLIGIGLVSLTYLAYTLLDGSAKWLVRSLPVLEVAWVRFVGHVLFAAALLLPARGLAIVRTRRPRIQALRSLLLLSMTAINFTVLQYLQLATVSAILYTVPIIVAMLAGPMLGERLDAHRWVAIVVGFCGVMVIVRPFGAAFHPAMLLSVFNALLAALFAIYTRRVSAHDEPEATQFLSALGAAIGLAPFGLAVWQYNMVSNLAQEGARWAAVRGAAGMIQASTNDVQNYVRSRGVGLNPTVTTYSVDPTTKACTTTPIAPGSMSAGNGFCVKVVQSFAPLTRILPFGTLNLGSTAQMIMLR